MELTDCNRLPRVPPFTVDSLRKVLPSSFREHLRLQTS